MSSQSSELNRLLMPIVDLHTEDDMEDLEIEITNPSVTECEKINI